MKSLLSRNTGIVALVSVTLLLPLWFCYADDLIPPTRTLESYWIAPGRVTVVSEPPGLEVFLDGSKLGETPVWLRQVDPGLRKLQILQAQTDIFVQPGKTLQVTLFKGSFIIIPEEDKKAEKLRGLGKKKPAGARKRAETDQRQEEKGLTPWVIFINGPILYF
jgi:hypothetical protein